MEENVKEKEVTFSTLTKHFTSSVKSKEKALTLAKWVNETVTMLFSVFTPAGCATFEYYSNGKIEIDDENGMASTYIKAYLIDNMPTNRHGYTVQFPPSTGEDLIDVLTDGNSKIRVSDNTIYGYQDVRKCWDMIDEMLDDWLDDEEDEE